MSEGEYGVVGTVGVGSVAAGSLDDYVQVVRRSVHRAGLDANRAPWDFGVDVCRHDSTRSLRQDTFPHHEISPRRISLLAGLKEGDEGFGRDPSTRPAARNSAARAAMWTSWPQACIRPFVAAKGAPVSSSMGRASSSALTATASPGGPTRARRPVWTACSTFSVSRASATSLAVTCSPWLGSGLACSRSRSPMARGSSSSRERISFRRRSVATQAPLAGPLQVRTAEEEEPAPPEVKHYPHPLYRGSRCPSGAT